VPRIHNTNTPLEVLTPRPQQPYKRKPHGLWWSQADVWKDLVLEGRSAGLGGRQVGAHDYEVHLQPEFRLLVLESLDDLMDFSCQYGQPMPHAAEGFFWQKPGTRDRYDPKQDPAMPERARAFLIDWPEVSRQWDGIEIPDLLLDRDRPRIDWLDTDWGVASGCAWHTKALEISLVKPGQTSEPGMDP
jgi:hypothetical protein